MKPLKKILGKSEVCDLPKMSGAYDRKTSDGNTLLLKLSEENDKHRFVYFGGDKVCSFLTDVGIYEYISNMGNNLTPYSIAIGEGNIYFFTQHFKFIKRNRNDESILLNTNQNSVDPFHYHVSYCGKNYFKTLRLYIVHSNFN